VFALVINFLNNDWQPKHVITSLFEETKTIGHCRRKSLQKSKTVSLGLRSLRKVNRNGIWFVWKLEFDPKT
jgi:hypothetical protein